MIRESYHPPVRFDADGNVRELAGALTSESSTEDEYVRWSPVHARLYLEMGLEAVEWHANWGVI